MRAVGLAFVVLASATTVSAKPLPRYGVFVFSNLCVDERYSGDAGGSRLKLVRKETGDTLAYDYGNGPVETASVRTLEIHGDKLTATAATNDGQLKLAAALADDSITLVSEFAFEAPGSAKPEKLKRATVADGEIPACTPR